MIAQVLLAAAGVLVLATAASVTVRFLACLVRSLKARHYGYAVVSLTGVLGMLAALGWLVLVWFVYAVAHTGKDAGTDLAVLLVTVAPFLLVAGVLWLLGGRLRSRQRQRAVDDK